MLKIWVTKLLRAMQIRNGIVLLAVIGLLALPMKAQAAPPPQPVGMGLFVTGNVGLAYLTVQYYLPDGTMQRVRSSTFANSTGGWITIPANAVDITAAVHAVSRYYGETIPRGCAFRYGWATNVLILIGSINSGRDFTCWLGNYKPTVLADQFSVTVDEGQTATMTGKVADADGDRVTLSATAGTVTNNGNGSWSWGIPTGGAVQSQIVTVTAVDSDGESWTTSFDLVVKVNTPPSVAANQPGVTVDEGQTATNTGTVSDADGDTVTLAASAGAITNNGDGTWSWSYAASDGPAQSQTVTVTGDDGQGHTTTATFALAVSNVAPAVTALTAPTSPQLINMSVAFSGAFTDPGILDTHTATWDWGDGTTSAGTVTETSGAGMVSDSHTYPAAGLYTVSLTVTDNEGGAGALTTQPVVVVDPSAGPVRGRGSINSPAGASKFSFDAQYKKGATVPSGSTSFQFQAGSFDFQSTSYQWLIVDASGTSAQFQGTGDVNGSDSYTFMVWVTDGSPDTFRIQIFDSSGNVVYDNGTLQSLAGGSIMIRN
jgi:hypothetical protein